ncbi:23763_t:CDS:2, partial [Racocetra persica]
NTEGKLRIELEKDMENKPNIKLDEDIDIKLDKDVDINEMKELIESYTLCNLDIPSQIKSGSYKPYRTLNIYK